MHIRVVVFDIGGVLLLDAGEGLEAKWERRLGLKEGEFIYLLQSLRPRYKLATLSNDWPGAREQQNRLFQLEEMLRAIPVARKEEVCYARYNKCSSMLRSGERAVVANSWTPLMSAAR